MKKLFVLIVVLLSVNIAPAITIDFEDVIPIGSDYFGMPIFTYTEKGFDFTDFDSRENNAIFGSSFGWNSDGNMTDILGWYPEASFDISESNGALFSIHSFDAACLTGESTGSFVVTGFLGGGGTLTTSFANTTVAWQSYSFDDTWTGLSSVRIQNLDMGEGGAIDNIKLVVPEPITLLANDVIEFVRHEGIENSLLAKIDTAIGILEDENDKNDKAAVNSLEAFINAVEAQRSKEISEEDADNLIAAAQQIIDLLSVE
jgi:hypothetical protein